MNFFKIFLGSCLGVLAGLLLLIIIGVMIVAGIASSAQDGKKALDKTSFLEIRSDRIYPEKTDNVETRGFSLKNDNVIGLHDMVAAINHAAEDPKIKGIVFRSMYSMLNPASASTLHHTLLEFKKSGKPVYAYADVFSEGSYYIASAADKIMLNPNGSIEIKGYGAMIPYFKEMLDKIGVKFDIYYAGQYKSATEPFRMDHMSDQNRMQTREYLNDLYTSHIDDIAQARKITSDELRKISNEYLIRNSADAIKYKLADTLGYLEDLYRLLSTDLGTPLKDKPTVVTINRYFSTPGIKPFVSSSNDKLGIVYAEGEIVDGEGNYGQIGSAKYSRILRKLRFDDKVKAVVLRVNSPGGSSLASDNILHEIDLLKSAGKPVVVSMGDYAASGGYYIACHADSIFAQPNTITGSIGVFLMVPNVSDLLDKKVGINIDTVNIGKFSTSFSPLLPWSSEEGIIAQMQTDRTYDRFLTVVSDGRNKTKDQIHQIAQGRVWSGLRARSNGLVDNLGNLEDAIACAVRLGKLDKYKTIEYPTVKEPIQKMIETFTNMEDNGEEVMLKKVFKSWYPTVSYLKNIDQEYYKPLMRMPLQLNNFK
ncbi:MAG: signal peptide peptidase SppA [Saprospiraceae bacterium]